MHDPKQIVEENHAGIINALEPLRQAISDFINRQGSSDEIAVAASKWREFRKSINNTYNVGVGVGIGYWTLVAFPLTGDIGKDVGQKNENVGSVN